MSKGNREFMEDLGAAPPTIERALADADAWSEDCEAGKNIPNWAMSLRVLAGAYRRQRLAIETRKASRKARERTWK